MQGTGLAVRTESGGVEKSYRRLHAGNEAEATLRNRPKKKKKGPLRDAEDVEQVGTVIGT
jgi:hypothetical protein